MSCNEKEKVIEYLKGNIEDSEEEYSIEQHIETCLECTALVEGYLEREKELDIPNVAYPGEENKLKEQVIHYEKGSRRIIIFTIVGLIMGWFSIYYISDTFIITKIILAIPYKANEFIHNFLHTHPDINSRYYDSSLSEFFPQDRWADFFAERITPMLIGGAIYGSLAFFTGDKRIFTIKKYIKYAIIWFVVITVWISSTFALNAYTVKKSNSLANVNGFILYSKSRGTNFSKDFTGYTNEVYERLRNAFYSESNPPKRLHDIKRDIKKEWKITLYFKEHNGASMECVINTTKNYLVTDEGLIYKVPESFCKYVQEYYNGTLK